MLLRKAVAMEDALNYNEPPDWFFSIRHNLGKALIQNRQNRVAIETYLEDLKHFPKNGWAYHGIKTAYAALNDEEKTAQYDDLFKKSWKHADVEL